MNTQSNVAEADAPAEVVKTVIRPDLNRYVRDKSGNGKRTHRTDDFVARTLAGKSIDVILNGAPLLGIDAGKWSHLNVGQQRMLVGNAIRHRLADTKNPLLESAVTDVYGEAVPPAPPVAAAGDGAAIEPGEAGEGQAEESAQEEAPKEKAKKTVSKAKK